MYTCDSGNTGTKFLSGGKNGSLFYFGNNKTLEWYNRNIIQILLWMGAEQPLPTYTPTRTHANDPKYGGLVYLSTNTGTIYQHLTV